MKTQLDYSEVKKLSSDWQESKPVVYVLLILDRGDNWSDDGYGETAYARTVDELQAVVNDLCREVPDYRSAKFAAGTVTAESGRYDYDCRLYDENDYEEDDDENRRNLDNA